MMLKTNMQKLITVKVATTLIILLFIEQVIDVVGTQLWLMAGQLEGNPLMAQFNQAHSDLLPITIGKFVLPLLLIPMTYVVFYKNDNTTKSGRFLRVFFVIAIIVAICSYIGILGWNFHCTGSLK